MQPSLPLVAEVAEVAVDPGTALVYEEGWQSWSPTTTYPLTARPWRAPDEPSRLLGYRPGRPAPTDAYQGEGLLALSEAEGGPVHVFAAGPGAGPVPSVRAWLDGASVRVGADGAVRHHVYAAATLGSALGEWAEEHAQEAGVGELRPAPTVWCSWYHYFTGVSEPDVLENLDAMDDLQLPVEVVQIDDGYQAEVGDWLDLSGRFSSLADIADRIRQRGRRAGIWVAPFLLGSRSGTLARHPEWAVQGASAGSNWGQQLSALDVTAPGAAEHLYEVFATLRAAGFDYFKIDFCYAGALEGGRHEDVPGVEAYRRGVRLVRRAIGPEAYLLGCGAPVLPSVGLLDAMRVSPDIAPAYEPEAPDLSKPSQRAAVLTGRGRAWQHGRFWVNDPDCLLARPGIERREEWAGHVERYGGLRASSDRLSALDDWGLATTRRLLSSVPPPRPFAG